MKEAHEIIKEIVPYYKKKGKPEEEFTLVYDSSSETLEPIYFFILDLMTSMGHSPQKIIDNFVSSPGSGHFGELGQRATIMQQQGTKLLADVNTVMRSVLNIIYDLKDFRTRLNHYNGLKSDKKEIKEAAKLSLKQLWMDKVDLAKGNSSIKAMATQGGFYTLIDAFLAAEDEKAIDKIDLNERIKRILRPRLLEFNNWVKESERELKKRYGLEKTYLRSQVNSLKLYTRWAKPYLRAASEMQMKESERDPALVKTFNTILLELSLLGKSEIKTKDAAAEGDLPKEFRTMEMKRKYYSCILVDFKFRGIPQRISQQSHYAFGGKTEVTFRAYALNEEELEKFNEELENSDLSDALSLVEGATTESLGQLQEEINEFLDEKPEEEEATKKIKDTSNPFAALFGKYEKKSSPKPKKEEKKKIIISPENWIEKTHIRPLAASSASDTTFALFDTYKKAHGMPSYT